MIYEKALNANGFHNIKFYIHRNSGNLIKIADILLKKVPKDEILTLTHMGYKLQINENLWMFGLFTTKAFTTLNEFTIYNIHLSNNLFSYVNRPIFVRNSILCEYIEIIDDLNKFPKYVINEVKRNNSIEKGLEIVAKYAEDGFIKSLYASNFNDPIILSEIEYNYNYDKENKMILNNAIKYNKNIDYLRNNNLTNDNIISLVERTIGKKENYKNEKIFSIKHIKY